MERNEAWGVVEWARAENTSQNSMFAGYIYPVVQYDGFILCILTSGTGLVTQGNISSHRWFCFIKLLIKHTVKFIEKLP